MYALRWSYRIFMRGGERERSIYLVQRWYHTHAPTVTWLTHWTIDSHTTTTKHIRMLTRNIGAKLISYWVTLLLTCKRPTHNTEHRAAHTINDRRNMYMSLSICTPYEIILLSIWWLVYLDSLLTSGVAQCLYILGKSGERELGNYDARRGEECGRMIHQALKEKQERKK